MDWRSIQEAIDYIENNIFDNLNHNEIAKKIYSSEFHFHRTFSMITGITIGEYIRNRKLSIAGQELFITKAKVIDIALKYGYESPESFTKAFTRFHGVNPSEARISNASLIFYNPLIINFNITGGFNMDNNSTISAIKGWFLSGISPQKYQLYFDEKVYNTGTKSACMKSIADNYDSIDFATVMQQFNAKNFIGKRVQFSGFVKSQEVDEWCGLWMRIDAEASGDKINMLAFDNMQNRPIRGTTEWNQYSCVLDVPENAAVINIGMLINGKGKVWLDNVVFQEVDYNTPTTDIISCELPDYPINLSFEEKL